MYPEADVYTKQLRALEAYARANPQSAQARFVMAYHYLTQGHVDAAVKQLKDVLRLQPADTLSAQLIAQHQPAGEPPPSAATSSETTREGKLTGSWQASPAKDSVVALTINDGGNFTWAVTNAGKPPMTITGNSTYANGTLTLAGQDGQNGSLVGKVTWQDDNHLTFRIVGGPQDDPGLKFAR
jgi:hypothetical protein